MARIRTIKPEFPQSESMGRVTRDARLLFVMLWTIADDAGRTRAASRMLASLLFPYDEDAGALILGWLKELEDEDAIQLYEIEGNSYLQITKWTDHQKIDRPSPSRLPPMPSKRKARETSRLPREQSSQPREDSSVDLVPSTLDLVPGREGTKEDTSSLRSDVVPAQPKIEPQAVLVLEPEREIATITELPAILDRTEEGAAFKAYNATADEMGWPVAQRLTDPRRRSLKLRLRECGGVDGWREAMAKARASPFLSGTGPRSKGYENWTPDLDYFLQPSTFTKLMEGKYDERINPGSNNRFSSAVFTGAASAIARRRRAREAGEGLEGQADFGVGAPIAAIGTG